MAIGVLGKTLQYAQKLVVLVQRPKLENATIQPLQMGEILVQNHLSKQ